MSAPEVEAVFAPTYAQARALFVASAQAAGLEVHTQPHPLPGRDGEALALDAVLDGPPNASRLLVVSSACHGVEGHCGSGVQVDALRHSAWREHARACGVAVLYLHALNPHGFSYSRRVTQENVDLNRNFQDFSQALPVNEAYRALEPLLLPPEWPPGPDNEAAVQGFIATHGMAAFQAAVSRGQHEFAQGMFFGGTAPTWSNLAVRQALRRFAASAQQLAWIDLHTGLGPSGVGERIFACRDDAAALQRARAWWGNGGATPVTSIYDGSSSSPFLTGLMWMSAYEECPQAEYTGLALEFGTVPMAEVMHALRADHWLHLHPQADAALAQAIKARLREVFYVDTLAWKSAVIEQSRQALWQAAEGLRGSL